MIDKSAAKGLAGCVVDSHTAGPGGGVSLKMNGKRCIFITVMDLV